MMRKLSDIIIEIAMQGLVHPKYGNSEAVQPLMFLAHVAWNRDNASSDYLEDQYISQLNSFPVPMSKLSKQLISPDWTEILERMIAYKRVRFPDDKRVITMCGYTPQGTLRVEWK